MAKIFAFFKRKDPYLGIVRYALGLIMVTYGVSKILRSQFVVIPFSLWQRPVEYLSGRMLAWAFLGYSPWFQVLLGVLELIPAVLLLFRRTTLIGAILMLPITLNVFLINHALNLWDDTKVVSLVLLLLNILVLVFEWKRIKAVALVIFGKGRKFKYTFVEIAVNLVALFLLVFFFSKWIFSYTKQTNALTGDWYNQRPNEWVLQSEKRTDSLPVHHLLKAYYGAFGEYSEINDTGYMHRDKLYYDFDQKHQKLRFFDKKNKLVKSYNYKFLDDSTLQLNGITDSTKGAQLVQIYKRRIMHTGAD